MRGKRRRSSKPSFEEQPAEVETVEPLRRSKRRCLSDFRLRADSCSLCGDSVCGNLEVASPSSCPSHAFHLACLKNWVELQKSRITGTSAKLKCPIESCTNVFASISVRRSLGGKVTQKLGIELNFSCAICQETIVEEVANPNCCQHHFCVSCLQKWSRTANTCPLDRKHFHEILVRSRIGSMKVDRTIKVGPRRPDEDYEDSSDPEVEPPDVDDYAGMRSFLRYMSYSRLADGDILGYCFYSNILRLF